MSADNNKRRILVTGASGFVGGRIVEAMHMSGFAKPVGTIRSWTRASRPGRIGAEVIVCDICNPDDAREAVQNVDAIVHCAYVDTRESIVGGTRNLLEAAAEKGISQFVFLSSAEVYDTDHDGELTEDAPTDPVDGNLYKNCKIEAEQLCREYASRGVQATVLRPSLIYGPFGQSWSIDIAERLQSGKWGLFEDREGIVNLVYVDDVVRAIFSALGNENAAGQTFNLNGPDRVSWNEYFQRFNEVLGLPPLKRISTARSGMRTFVMDFVGKVADLILSRFEDQLMEIYLRGGLASRLMKKVKGELNSTPSGRELNDLYQRKFYLSTDKIRTTLNFESQTDLESGMRHTAQWLELHELLKNPLPGSNPRPDAVAPELVSR